MSPTWRDVDAAKANETAQAAAVKEQVTVYVLPPGYIQGCFLSATTTGTLQVDVGVVDVAGATIKIKVARNPLETEWEVLQTAGFTYYVYIDRAAALHLDVVSALFNSDFMGYYHPFQAWRYLGHFALDANGLVTSVVNQGAVRVEDIESEVVTTEKLAAGAATIEKLSVVGRSYINNVTQTGVLNAWGGVTEEGAGSAGIMSVEAVTVPDGTTAFALRMTNNGDYSIRTKTFAVNHDAIYRCTAVVKKSDVEGRVYFGVSAYAAVTEGAQASANGAGNKLMIPYPVATRVAGAENANLYFSYVASGSSPIAWTTWTSYLIGANRSVDDVPQQIGSAIINFIKLKSDTTHAAIRVLNWENTSSRTLDIYNPTVVEMGQGKIVAENIDVTNLDVHKCTVTDDLSRYIEISAAQGLYAEDEDGNIIHDIPDIPILSSMKYGGHAIWRDGPSGAMAIIDSLDYTDAETSRAATSATTNSDISSAIPSGMTNAKGVFCLVIPTMVVPATKVLAGTKIQLIAKFSTVYNVAPAAYNYFHYWVQDNFTAGTAIWLSPSIPALLPVVYNGSTPYITWNLYMNYTGMDSASANYYLVVSLRILGVFV